MQQNFDLGSLLFTQGKVIAFDEILDRITEGRMALDQNRLPFDDTHFDKSSAQRAGTVDAGDGCPLSGPQEMKKCGFRHKIPFDNRWLSWPVNVVPKPTGFM